MCDYREELESAIDWARESMPEAVKAAVSECNASLYYGQSAGAWTRPLAIVSDWANSIADIHLIDFAIDDEGEECEIDAGSIDCREIVRGVIGRELAQYI